MDLRRRVFHSHARDRPSRLVGVAVRQRGFVQGHRYYAFFALRVDCLEFRLSNVATFGAGGLASGAFVAAMIGVSLVLILGDEFEAALRAYGDFVGEYWSRRYRLWFQSDAFAVFVAEGARVVGVGVLVHRLLGLRSS